jgi:hypothetical protein
MLEARVEAVVGWLQLSKTIGASPTTCLSQFDPGSNADAGTPAVFWLQPARRLHSSGNPSERECETRQRCRRTSFLLFTLLQPKPDLRREVLLKIDKPGN